MLQSSLPQPFQRRFNFRKAHWPAFQQNLERKIAHLLVDPKNYDNFTKIVHQAAQKNIQRGCHTQYIPGLDVQSSKLYEQNQQLYDSDPFAEGTIIAGERLMTSISESRQQKWQSLLESTDMAEKQQKGMESNPKNQQ